MIGGEKLIAFAIMSAAASVIPGSSMLFTMGQSIWRDGRSAAVALAGVQFGYVWWWTLAALGLGTLAEAYPVALHVLAIGGALYLAWLGLSAFRGAGKSHEGLAPEKKASAHAFRDGIFVAMSNPKSLIYIVALLPPFVDPASAIVPQLILLAAVAMVIDVAIGTIYILAGNGLARAMTRGGTRLWVDRAVGTIFLVIAAGILADQMIG